MDPCGLVDGCIDKVLARFDGYEAANGDSLDTALTQIRHLKQELLLGRLPVSQAREDHVAK